MICFPNAKINLGLHVVEKRPDGFHNIETVFYPVNLCDTLEIISGENDTVKFTTSGLPIPGEPAGNLIPKAYNLLFSRIQSSSDPGSRIHLHKVIPTGAGLGGGSSDAAYTLKLLNDLWQLNLSVPHLQHFARQLGSDCAFFIENKPVVATGRGDHFESIDLDLSGYQIVVAVPPVHVSTPEAYGMVTPQKPFRSLADIIKQPIETWRGNLVNDFEEPVMNKFPVIREINEELYNQGALYAAMSGSGSAVFGLFSPQLAVGSWQFDSSIRVYLL
ncbi:MAG: 4-(cytidine 5'-diphospho)-2-C-methyl-D-erythritol kinase [Bacteroidales bacterium]|nr:4-(cytidine 5'-diphospho)-2-C-methyl-D-erythritol kinase [Bacteroidales bacterium]